MWWRARRSGGPAGDADRLRRRTAFAAGSRSGPSGSGWPPAVIFCRRTAAGRRPSLIIDGLLGTGLGSAPRAPYDALIEAANRHSAPVVALDIPSGLLAESGAVPGAVVRAAHTVTFIGLKPIADRPCARLGRATSSECARLIGLAGEATGTDSASYRRGVAALAASAPPLRP